MKQPVELLLVEDNPAHTRLVEEALREVRLTNPLKRVASGEEALRYLRRKGKHAGVPGLMLLDLHLPDLGGWDLLAEIRRDPALQRLPVVVQTSSREDEDMLQACNFRVNGYITKPVDGAKLLAVLNSLDGLWLALVADRGA